MKILDHIALTLLFIGFPTAILIYMSLDKGYWQSIKSVCISIFFLIVGLLTAPLFALGFAWFVLEDWLDDRADRQLKGA